VVLAACLSWLVIQNSLLILTDSLRNPPDLLVAAQALAKAAALLLIKLRAPLAIALLGAIVISYLYSWFLSGSETVHD
jgi:hypothetical protein